MGIRINLFLLLAIIKITSALYIHVGCYNDKKTRAISGLMTTYVSSSAIEECAKRAKAENNEFFAVEVGTQCFTSSNAAKTYATYGKATGCANGRGGHWLMDIYKIAVQYLPGTTWNWYHNGQNKNGRVTFTMAGKVKWNGGSPQGSWSVKRDIVTTTFNGVFHRLKLDGRGAGVLLEPKRTPPSKMTKVGAAYAPVGCYNDKKTRAISGLMTTYAPTLAIEECAKRAKAENNAFFGVQDGIQCFTSSNAAKTYATYGKATGCSNGRGGHWFMDIYKISG